MGNFFSISMDTMLSMLSLAISVGGIVPIFFLRDQKKVVLLSLSIALAMLIAISTIAYVKIRKHNDDVELISNQVIETLSKNHSQTFDQLDEQLYYPDFSDLSEAMKNLVNSGRVKHTILEVHEDNDNTESFRVRTYFILKDN